jgi:glycosyltransferase involved in cell wall biosynthesis
MHMRILLIGHACGPGLGSEPGNTWHLAWNLSRDHHVWVLTHTQHRDKIEKFIAENPNPRLQFVYVTLKRMDPWNPQRGERGLRLHYMMWQRAAARVARELCQSVGADVVHHFSLGTIKAPPHLHRMPVPVVWGPMGGGQTMPVKFRRYFKGQLLEEYLRIAFARLLPFMPSLRRMLRRSAVVLGNNMETIELLRAAGAGNAQFALETALPSDAIDPRVPERQRGQTLTALWAGRLETRKALPLALEAIAKTKMPVQLKVAGDGPKRQEWEQIARDMSLGERVQFLGRVPFEQMAQQFRDADVMLFTSLRDSTGAVVLEGMAKALPVVSLDHQGVRTMVPDEAAIKVPVTTPEQTSQALAEALDALARSPERRDQLARGALVVAAQNTWDQRAAQMAGFYRTAVLGAPTATAGALRRGAEAIASSSRSSI